jgi:lipopolysaccharide transport system permease protein
MSSTRTVVVERRRGLGRLGLDELWEYRDLFAVLVQRDIRVRYQQTVFGAAWAVLQPLLLMAVFAVFLGRLADVPSNGVPYALFAYVGLVPWTFFAQGVAGATNSLVENERLVTKIYFPRLLMPAASSASYALDFVIGHVLMVGLMLWFGFPARATMVLLPLLALALVLVVLGFGIGLAALNVRYRDVRYAIPFGIQVLLFVTPVVYPASLVPRPWHFVYCLNPVAGIIDLYRWAILGTPHLPWTALSASAAAALALLCLSVVYFQRVERSFADVI